jgi:hypothetical protein
MIAVRHRLMPTIRTVLMSRFMCAAVMCRRAGIWIFVSDCNAMFLNLTILALMMQMPIVEIVCVAVVLNRGVPAVRAMLVVVIVVQMCHESSSFLQMLCSQNDNRSFTSSTQKEPLILFLASFYRLLNGNQNDPLNQAESLAGR